MNKTEIRPNRNAYTNHVELLIIQGDHYCKEMTMEKIGDGIAQTPLSISFSEAQALTDELYRLGFQPTQLNGSAGQLGATENHLKDMQTIAFGFLDKIKK